MITKRKGTCLFIGIIFMNVVCCLAKDVCYISNNNIEVYCEDGYYCCQNNTRCCSDGITTGAIIGITLAAIFVFAFCVAAALMLVKKQKTPGRRVNPNDRIHNIQNVAVINPPPYAPYPTATTNSTSYTTGSYNTASGNFFLHQYPTAPPPYTPSYQPPPAYSETTT